MYYFRKSIFILTTLVLCFLFVSSVSAHSVLEKSNPENGEKLETSIRKLELSFNTKIEKGSTLYIVDENKEKIDPSSVNLTENRLEAVFSTSLDAGTYQVNWEIVGADGHLIKESYSFTVLQNGQSNSPDGIKDTPPQSKNNNVTVDEQTEDVEEEIAEQNADTSANNNNKLSPLLYGIIFFLVIAGISILIWMYITKKKK